MLPLKELNSRWEIPKKHKYFKGIDESMSIDNCVHSFFGASKYDPKSDLWTRITLFQGAPLPHQLQEKNACDWIFPYLSDA